MASEVNQPASAREATSDRCWASALATLADVIPDAVVFWDHDCRARFANARYWQFTRTTPEQLLGKTPLEAAPSPGGFEAARRMQSALEEVLRTGEACAIELEFETPVGRAVHGMRVHPHRDDHDQIVGVLSMGHNVSEARLEERQQMVLRFALDHVQEAVSLIDKDGRFLFVNEECSRSLGYSASELLAMRVADIAPALQASVWRAHWTDLRAHGSLTFDAVYRRKDGSILPVEVAATHCLFDGIEYNITLARDISLRRRVEGLATSEQEMRALVENLPDNIARYGPDGSVTYVNQTLLETLGVTRAQILGSRRLGGPPEFVAAFEPYFSAIRRVLDSGRPESVEICVPTPRGRSYHQIRVIAERDASGRIRSALSLGRDVTDRHRYLEELAAARDEAVAATSIKSEFLANVSHEIRTPMNGVIGLAELLLTRELAPPARELADGIHRSAVALLGVLNDILDLSKLEAGRLDLAEESFDVRMMVGEVIDLLRPGARAKSLLLELELDAQLPQWWIGDTGRLRQVLLNLAGNAVKFTQEGSIKVRVWKEERDGQSVLCGSVTDTGIGIPTSRLEAVFQPFTQADGGITRRFGGSGLGLTIARQLLLRMGGDLFAASEEGEGSTFVFRVPLTTAGRAPSTAIRSTGVLACDEGEAARRVVPHLGFRVLVVDDNAVNRVVATRFLERWGCDVSIAEDGEQALERMQTSEFDVVLMDVQMPVLDGLTATRRWRVLETASGRHLPILALTAHAMAGDRESCLRAGMDGYVAKPIRSSELLAALREHVEPREDEDTQRAA
ncbi:MAG: PAS domain-containing protein [Candidatus Eisenbacteria bacterium]